MNRIWIKINEKLDHIEDIYILQLIHSNEYFIDLSPRQISTSIMISNIAYIIITQILSILNSPRIILNSYNE